MKQNIEVRAYAAKSAKPSITQRQVTSHSYQSVVKSVIRYRHLIRWLCHSSALSSIQSLTDPLSRRVRNQWSLIWPSQKPSITGSVLNGVFGSVNHYALVMFRKGALLEQFYGPITGPLLTSSRLSNAATQPIDGYISAASQMTKRGGNGFPSLSWIH